MPPAAEEPATKPRANWPNFPAGQLIRLPMLMLPIADMIRLPRPANADTIPPATARALAGIAWNREEIAPHTEPIAPAIRPARPRNAPTMLDTMPGILLAASWNLLRMMPGSEASARPIL